jgi:prepilin-type N-terminal cleavage/methylation domain-containing protein
MIRNVSLKQVGVTLIELLVVVAIIGILAGVGIPAFNGYIKNARLKDAQVGLRTIAASQESYRLLNGGYTMITSTVGSMTVSCPSSFTSDPCINCCVPSLSSSSGISSILLSNLKLNTGYFYFCTYAYNGCSPPAHGAVALDISSMPPKYYAINQSGVTYGF